MKKNFITQLILAFCSFSTIYSQDVDKNTFSISFELNGGASLGKMKHLTNNSWRHEPGVAFGGTAAFHYDIKNRLSFHGGMGIAICSYAFKNSGDSVGTFFQYDLSYWLFHFQGGVQYLWTPGMDKQFYTQLTAGAQIGDNTSSSSDQNGFIFTFDQTPYTVPYLKPELGFRFHPNAGERHELSLLYRLNFEDVMSGDLITNNSHSKYRSRGNYIALSYRYLIPVHVSKAKKEKPAKPTKAEKLKQEFSSRPVEVRKTIDVENEVIQLYVYDSGAQVDGDIISLVVNGEFVLEKYKLKKGQKHVEVRMREGDNTIVMHAHNEGRVPPNTAAITIQDGSKRHHLVLNSNLDSSGALSINYKK